jgi:hypothetical protein
LRRMDNGPQRADLVVMVGRLDRHAGSSFDAETKSGPLGEDDFHVSPLIAVGFAKYLFLHLRLISEVIFFQKKVFVFSS